MKPNVELIAALVGIFLAVCAVIGASTGPSEAADIADFPSDASLVEDLADGRLDSYSLAEAALVASGADTPEKLAHYRARLDEIVGAAVDRTGTSGRPERRARRLLAELHRTTLRRYDALSDRFPDLIDQGLYNCVSATLLYVIAARQAGLELSVAETPLHVFAVLDTGYRRLDIETTSPAGFDVKRDLRGFRSFVLANKYATEEDLARQGVEALYEEFHRLTRSTAAEQMIAFLYHNAGLRALQSGDTMAAARYLINAARIYPGLAYRSEGLRNTLAWAIREQYDAGRTDEAFRLAQVAMRFFPDRATVRERFAAVAARVVEDAALRSDLAGAEAAETQALELITDEEARRKLESFTAPVLARAAVDSREWGTARRHAARFRAVAADPLSAEQLALWVDRQTVEAVGPSPGLFDFTTEMNKALTSPPQGAAPADYQEIVRAIGALASGGRLDEALAVARLQRSSLVSSASAESLDGLMRAITGAKVNALVESRRFREAGAEIEAALALWPEDEDLLAMKRQIVAGLTADAAGIVSWPSPECDTTSPVPASTRAGTGQPQQ